MTSSFSTIAAVTTGTTCGAACWYAKEQDCRCCCGGTNHGCLLVAGVEQPRRNATIQGVRYVLGTIGTNSEAHSAMRDFICAPAVKEEHGRTYSSGYKALPATNEKGAIVWVRAASDSQAKWPEVVGWTADHTRVVYGRERAPRAHLVWVREDVAEAFDGLGL